MAHCHVTRIGCPDLDPDWPGPDGKPRGNVLCVLYPSCKCGRFDVERAREQLRSSARREP